MFSDQYLNTFLNCLTADIKALGKLVNICFEYTEYCRRHLLILRYRDMARGKGQNTLDKEKK